MRILITRLSALGDVAAGLHVLASIKRLQPDAEVDWLVEDRFAALLDGHPQLRRVLIYPRNRTRRLYVRPQGLLALAGFVKTLRSGGYDLALDLQGNLKSGVLTWLSGARRRMGLGRPFAREGNRFFVRERIPPPEGHRLAAGLALVRAALGGAPSARALLPARAIEGSPLILHPGTSRFGAFKMWPGSHFADLGDRLAGSLGAEVVLTAGPGEQEQAEAVKRLMRTPARVAETPSLRKLVDLLAGARLVVACDTGPAHIAAALGVPTLTLYGPKDPRVLAPTGPRARATRAGVRCSPCALRSCPDPVCMTELSVDAVEREALSLLEGPA